MKKLTFLLITFCTFNLFAKVNIITTLPEFKWFIDQIGGEKVQSKSLLNGNEDPHFVDAIPSFIVKASNADLLIVNGMQLEMGWLPKVIQMAGNKKINLGNDGYCDASKNLKKLQVIKNYDRSMGDVHPVGNPHYSISIKQMIGVSKTLLDCLTKVDPEHKEVFKKNYLSLVKSLNNLMTELKAKTVVLKKINFMSYHLEFLYFFNDFNLKSFGTLEKVPGVLPSASQLLEKAKMAKKDKVNLIVAGNTNPKKYLEKFKETTSIPYVQVDLHMTNEYDSYFSYQRALFKKITKNAR